MLLDIKHYPVNLALNASDLDAALLDSKDDVYIIYVGGDYDMTISLGKSNHLPVEISYLQYDHEKGREVETIIVLDDWTWNDGVRIAYRQKRYSDDKLVSHSRYSGHRIRE